MIKAYGNQSRKNWMEDLILVLIIIEINSIHNSRVCSCDLFTKYLFIHEYKFNLCRQSITIIFEIRSFKFQYWFRTYPLFI